MADTRANARQLVDTVLSCSRPGILTDIDGTISQIAPSPEAATVESAARAALCSLSDRLALTGAITGRAALDAFRMVGLEGLVYSGNHGMELWRNGELEQSATALRYQPAINRVLDTLSAPSRLNGLVVENKGLTASIHYRAADNPELAESEILAELDSLIVDDELVITRGRKVIELRPPVELSKGTSVIELAKMYQLDGLIYFGDDVTDVDAFKALSSHRTQRNVHFYSIGVRNDPTPQAVIDHADALVDGVEGVVTLLEAASRR
jgi:trehalose 6-phosphate phosphatase